MKKKALTEAQILATIDRIHAANTADEKSIMELDELVRSMRLRPAAERETINYSRARIMILGRRIKRRGNRLEFLKRMLGEVRTPNFL